MNTVTYTFYPLVDNSNSHLGLYLLSILFALIFWLALFFFSDGEKETKLKISLILSVFMIPTWMFAANESFTEHHPLNEKVIGTLVGYDAEGFISGSGKHKSEHHYLYVKYSVPEGDVIFRASEGVVYPNRAVLYKN